MTSLGYLQYSEINDNSSINEMEKKKETRHNTTIKKRHEGGSVVNNGENVQNMLINQ
jgi:hypothetical protein